MTFEAVIVKLLSTFGTTWICESTFSTVSLLNLKTDLNTGSIQMKIKHLMEKAYKHKIFSEFQKFSTK